MTDIFAPQTDSAPAPTPMSEPAPVTQSAPAPAPEAERSDFDKNLDDFLGRDLLAEMTDGGATPPASSAPSAPAAQTTPPGGVQPAPAGATPSIQPAPASGGTTPPATTTQPAPAGETAPPQEVNPELLLQMFGAATPPAAAAPTTPTPAAAPANADDDEVFAPFTSQMQLPQQLVSTIFESEDPVQRQNALSAMIAAIGNASVAAMEQRIKDFHAPRMAQQFQAAQQAQASAKHVETHFYGANPDLAPYKQIVTKAGEVYLNANPTAVYDESTAAAIAALARRALQQMGHTVAPPAGAPTPTPPQPAPSGATPPPSPYMAGGASPGGTLETPMDPTDPGNVFSQMVGGWD